MFLDIIFIKICQMITDMIFKLLDLSFGRNDIYSIFQLQLNIHHSLCKYSEWEMYVHRYS